MAKIFTFLKEIIFSVVELLFLIALIVFAGFVAFVTLPILIFEELLDSRHKTKKDASKELKKSPAKKGLTRPKQNLGGGKNKKEVFEYGMQSAEE